MFQLKMLPNLLLKLTLKKKMTSIQSNLKRWLIWKNKLMLTALSAIKEYHREELTLQKTLSL